MNAVTDAMDSPTRELCIAHVTDLEPRGKIAFEHALALALTSQSELISIHANDAPSAFDRMPPAHHELVRWGKLAMGAGPGDEAKLGMRHTRLVENCCDDVVDTLLSALARTKPDLLVAATRARDSVRRMLTGSVAEALARQVSAPTLLLPTDARPFVSSERGALSLSRILVAAGDPPSARAGLMSALWFADVADAGAVDIELFHVGDARTTPELPEIARKSTRLSVRHVDQGALEALLAGRAETWPAELLVMATRGHDSLRDVLLGSHAERTLHRAACPMLCVPLV